MAGRPKKEYKRTQLTVPIELLHSFKQQILDYEAELAKIKK
jgi:hypothetical protein